MTGGGGGGRAGVRGGEKDLRRAGYARQREKDRNTAEGDEERNRLGAG